MENAEYSAVFKNTYSVFSENITKLFENKTFTDVKIICKDSHNFNAHRVILSAYSPVLANILQSEPEPVIVFTDINKNEMLLLLDYMYKGCAKVPESDVPALLKAAKELQLSGFKRDAEGINNSEDHSYVMVEANNPTSSPVLAEENGENVIEEVNLERADNGAANTNGPRWISTLKTDNRDIGSKVINPFARKQKSLTDSDSTMYDYKTCSQESKSQSLNKTSESLTKTRKERSERSSSLLNDSDVELIEPRVSIITESQLDHDNCPEICRKIYKHSKKMKITPPKLDENDFTSDESDIQSKRFKRAENNTPVNCSDNEAPANVLLNPAALKNKSTDSPPKRYKRIRRSSEMEDLNQPGTSRNKGSRLEESVKRKAVPERNKDNKSEENRNEEPFKGYCRKSSESLKKFCLICWRFKKNNTRHIQRIHNLPMKVKKYFCPVCSIKFAFKPMFEMHKCGYKKKKK